MLRIHPLLVVYQRIMEDDRINEALVNYMAGTIHINMAWVYRTSRVASAVTEEGWMRFNYHLERARVFLKQSWKLQPDVPHAAAGLITVAKANVEEWSARHWFVLSVRAQFSFGPAYSNYMDAIQPKWGGSEEELVEFGRECLATRAFGTIVPMQAFYAISSYADDVGRDKAWKNPDVIEWAAEYADAFDEWLKTDERKQAHEIALGAAIGAFWGVFPTFGLSTILSLLLYKIFRFNIVAAISAAFISNPLTSPFLLMISYKVGNYFIETNIQFDYDTWYKNIPQIGYVLIVGSAIVSTLTGFIIYFITKYPLKEDE